MPQITTDGKPLTPNATMNFPAMEIPCFRTLLAVERKVDHRILIQVVGGIGDYICAEPAIRWACRNFKDMEISISTYVPEFFTHLPLARIFDLSKESPDWSQYYCFRSINSGDELGCQFFTHIYTHVVDYHSLLMFRMMLEPEEKNIRLPVNEDANAKARKLINPETDVLIHPGRTWPSRTFPKVWWDGVISHIFGLGKRPVIIGAESMNNCGTVDVSPEGCLDLRGRLSLTESIAVTRTAQVLLTNDSSPLHMAASGDAWIGFVSTVRKPGTLLHYRNAQIGWRMKSFGTGCLLNELDLRPNNPTMIRFDDADPTPWLPKPREIAEWAVNKLS